MIKKIIIRFVYQVIHTKEALVLLKSQGSIIRSVSWKAKETHGKPIEEESKQEEEVPTTTMEDQTVETKPKDSEMEEAMEGTPRNTLTW